MAGSRLSLTLLDHGGEQSNVSFQGASIGAANFDAQVALHEALVLAVQDITTMNVTKRMNIASEAILTSSRPADPYAQREIKWLVRYHDNVTGDRLTVTIPGADLSLLDVNTERMDPANAAYTAFVTAFQDYVKAGEVVDNAVVVDEIIFVGRNS